jgi:NADPH:quinone reductase-like Zn-dependent oxidoreductase
MVRAAVHTRFGPPEVINVIEVDKPAPKGDEILIRVHATTVNRTDCGFRAARPAVIRLFAGITKPRHRILGTEFAGEIEAVGPGVTSFTPGDKIFGYDEKTFGAHAEYMTISERRAIATIPPRMTYEEAAPATEGSHYALGFIRKAGIREGHDVLVYGATGGIGSAAVQLITNLGATVTAVCGTGYTELVAGLGADRVVDYMTQDFTKDEQRYDVVLDAVGKSSFGVCRQLLKPRGIYLSSELGPKGQNPFLVPLTHLLGGKRVKFPLPRYDKEMIEELKRLMAAGAFTPLIGRVFPLDEIVDAYRYVESGQKIGNVVISVDAAR